MIPGPGMKRKNGKWSKNTQPGGNTEPFSPEGGRKGNKRSRKYGPSIITPTLQTAPSNVSGAQQQQKYVLGANNPRESQDLGERVARGHQARSWKGRGKGKRCLDASQGCAFPPKFAHQRHSHHSQHQFGSRDGSRHCWADIAHICPKLLPWARGLPPPAVGDRQRCLPVRH